jgi:orotidine-5'-phosphate decarboxylase
MDDPRDALCVALDGTDRAWLLGTAERLAGLVGWVKLGLEGFTAHGPDLARELLATGCRLFLDLKLHDIPATVRRAAANCAASGAGLVTVHAAGGREMMEAAVEGAHRHGQARVVAVTVLTSLGRVELDELGLATEPAELVARWAALARASGVDGVVCSAREAAAVRVACGPEAFIVTPGVRPLSTSANDQRRVVTPAEAVRSGADLLVVGRPITTAPSPVEAARSILEEMAAAVA